MKRNLKVWILSRGASTVFNVTALFTLDVWLYKTTNSFTTFCIVAAMASLPYIFWAPIAGTVVDKYNKRKVLIGVESMALLLTLAMLLSIFSFGLSSISIGIYAMTMGCVGITKLVGISSFLSTQSSKQTISKVNGVWQTFAGVSALCSPIIGAQIIERGMINYLLSACSLVYLAVIISLLNLKAQINDDKEQQSNFSFREVLASIKFGAEYIGSNCNLFNMVKFFMVVNIFVTVFTITLTPYLQTLYTTTQLGIATAILGVGGVVSGGILSRIVVLEHLQGKIYLLGVGLGFAILLFGASSDLVFVSMFVFCVGLFKGAMLSLSETYWQATVPKDIQGRVFAARRLFSYLTVPISIVISMIAVHLLDNFLAGADWVKFTAIKPIEYSFLLIISGLGLALHSFKAKRQMSYRDK